MNLETLCLFRNQVNDLNPLAPLANLETFYLFGNGIESLAPLYNLTNLKELWLGRNKISDLSCVLLLFSDTNVQAGAKRSPFCWWFEGSLGVVIVG
jgi:Leucine-rich repeat (LRR) protein